MFPLLIYLNEYEVPYLPGYLFYKMGFVWIYLNKMIQSDFQPITDTIFHYMNQTTICPSSRTVK